MRRIINCLLMSLLLCLIIGENIYAATNVNQILYTEQTQIEENQTETSQEETSREETSQEETSQEETSQGETSQSGIELSVAAPSAILMEASTGKVIYEKDATEKRSPASITKIMTLLLTFEALEKGKIKLSDEVVTSEYAKSMGGSQVFLETGEVQTVDTLLKCITVASGNDASVTMAEHIAGSEEEFVKLMNQKAMDLHMEDTHFEDCCGLTNSANHYTTAKDVAIMSRELITKYPDIYKYTKIWMEDITHNTAKGSTNFTLSSTNKLIKQYQWATGLKTGSTNVAKYCLSATARKDDIDMIAVVMAAPDYKIRFQDAITMLNYGFSVSNLYEDKNEDILQPVAINGAIVDSVPIEYEGAFRYLDVEGNDLSQIEKEIELKDVIEAPTQKGDVVGEAVYRIQGKKIGSVPILYGESIKKAVYKDYVMKVFNIFLL